MQCKSSHGEELGLQRRTRERTKGKRESATKVFFFFYFSGACTDSCQRAAWIFGNTHRLISQNSCTCTQVFVCHCGSEARTRHMSPFERVEVGGGAHTCEMTYIFGNAKWSVFTFLYAQFTSAAPGLLYFKFPPTWPKLPVSTGLTLIRSLILTDILKVHTNSGMFGAMLPTAGACQYY